MPNHFDSIIVINGDSAELNRFIDDFQKASLNGRLCICQFADPIPLILYECLFYEDTSFDKQMHCTGRPLTDEEKEEIRAFGYSSFGEYAKKWWALKYGCYDTSLQRVSPTKAIYQFWVPLEPLRMRICQLLHIRYPSLTFYYRGQDEMDPELFNAQWIVRSTDPIQTKEEIDRNFQEMRENERRQFIERLRSLNFVTVIEN